MFTTLVLAVIIYSCSSVSVAFFRGARRASAVADLHMIMHYPSRSNEAHEYIYQKHIHGQSTKFSNPASPLIVGVAGGSGSGKTTLVKAITEILGNERASHLSHDSYYKDLRHLTIEERSKTNFDHPDSLDTELLTRHLTHLKSWQTVEIPVYDFKTHSRTEISMAMSPKPIIIVDGILIFSNPKLMELFDIKIFVDTSDDIRLIRRISRDTKERQRSVDSVIDQYQKTVRPMFQQFVEPSRLKADVIIPADNGIQRVALEMCVSHLQELISIRNDYNIFQ